MSEPSTQDGPLSPEQERALFESDRRLVKIAFAAKVARFDAWTLLVAAALCAPFAFVDLFSGLIAAVLGVLGWVELDGSKRLRQLEPGGGRQLAFNQLALLLAVDLYAGFSLHSVTSAPPLSTQLSHQPGVAQAIEQLDNPALTSTLGDVGTAVHDISIAVYVALALCSTLAQGLLALYYLSRRRLLLAHLAQTPDWIRRLQRARAS